MANVMDGGIIEGFDVETGVSGDVELFARLIGFPFRFSDVCAAASVDNFHDFRRARVKSQHRVGHNDPDAFACSVGEKYAVADAFAVEINVGFFNDAHLIKLAHV